MNHCDICGKLTTTRTDDGIAYCGRCWRRSYPEDIAALLAETTWTRSLQEHAREYDNEPCPNCGPPTHTRGYHTR